MNRDVTPRRCLEIWSQYAEFRKGQIALSTYKRDYQKIQRRLELLKKQSPFLETATEIRNHLLSKYSAETTRRTLVQLNAAFKWAMLSSITNNNPFEGLPSTIRKTKPSDRAWAAFTTEERDVILHEFMNHCPTYYPWVAFLFWTGCRPEEAASLKWADISLTCEEILFRHARPVDTGDIQTTKNGRVTRFPANTRLQKLLKGLEPQPRDRDQWVFRSISGGAFDYKNFQTRYWRPFMLELVELGKIAFYLPQYNCRHTFITEALNHLSVSDVAYLCRVSPKIIYEHYAGRSRRPIIPEF